MLSFKSHLGHRIKRPSYNEHETNSDISGILKFLDRLEILIRCNQIEQFLTSCCLGCGWRWKLFLDLGNGNDNPSDPPILWDHHFMIKSYFNFRLCIFVQDICSLKAKIKILSTFIEWKYFSMQVLMGESSFSDIFFQRWFRIAWQLTGAKTCSKHLWAPMVKDTSADDDEVRFVHCDVRKFRVIIWSDAHRSWKFIIGNVLCCYGPTGAKIGPHLYYLETALALLMVDWKSVESSF